MMEAQTARQIAMLQERLTELKKRMTRRGQSVCSDRSSSSEPILSGETT